MGIAAADEEGLMVSLIQSNYMGFGSGLVVPGTGISLQNRGASFRMDESHPNRVEGAKRPFHIIIPGFLTRAGDPVGPFGVMGGHMQPQGHLQILQNSVDLGMDPQSALNAPRWCWDGGLIVRVEATASQMITDLTERGHDVRVVPFGPGFGRGQIIWSRDDGYIAGSDGRADGCALGF